MSENNQTPENAANTDDDAGMNLESGEQAHPIDTDGNDNQSTSEPDVSIEGPENSLFTEGFDFNNLALEANSDGSDQSNNGKDSEE